METLHGASGTSLGTLIAPDHGETPRMKIMKHPAMPLYPYQQPGGPEVA
jgi:hypothetical protein